MIQGTRGIYSAQKCLLTRIYVLVWVFLIGQALKCKHGWIDDHSFPQIHVVIKDSQGETLVIPHCSHTQMT